MAKAKTGVNLTQTGNTFLAMTLGMSGGWAIHLDLQEAIIRAYWNSGGGDARSILSGCGDASVIKVYYGKNDELEVNHYGGFRYNPKNPPIPIGLFLVTRETVPCSRMPNTGDQKVLRINNKMTLTPPNCDENCDECFGDQSSLKAIPRFLIKGDVDKYFRNGDSSLNHQDWVQDALKEFGKVSPDDEYAHSEE